MNTSKIVLSNVALAVSLSLSPAVAGDSKSKEEYKAERKAELAQQHSSKETAKNDEVWEKKLHEAKLEGSIATAYTFNEHLNPFDIEVEVRGDTAYLSGEVESEIEKELAEEIAMGMNDIAAVENRLQVGKDRIGETEKNMQKKGSDDEPSEMGEEIAEKNAEEDDSSFMQTVSDATTTATIKSKLLWNKHTNGLDIEVSTKNGVVTLEGEAESEAAKELALRIAENTEDVRSVNNLLITQKDEQTAEAERDAEELEEETEQLAENAEQEMEQEAREGEREVSDAWITTKVKSTLLFSRNVSGLDIEVDTKQGNVALTGEVDSETEKELATELAGDVVGVKNVDASAIKVR